MKEPTNFEYIWREWITPLISDLQNQMDTNFVKQCDVKIRDISKIETVAEKYYQKKRREAKNTFYGEYKKENSDDEHWMDFHKLAAVLCRTLIEYKVFDFDVDKCQQYINDNNIDKYNTNWVVKNALVNFRLAFYTSVVFLYQSMLFQYSSENPELFEKLKQQGKLDLYDTQKKDYIPNTVQESFENCLVLDLAKRDIGNRSFDYFMYAIIMYQLEEHNKHLLS